MLVLIAHSMHLLMDIFMLEEADVPSWSFIDSPFLLVINNLSKDLADAFAIHAAWDAESEEAKKYFEAVRKAIETQLNKFAKSNAVVELLERLAANVDRARTICGGCPLFSRYTILAILQRCTAYGPALVFVSPSTFLSISRTQCFLRLPCISVLCIRCSETTSPFACGSRTAATRHLYSFQTISIASIPVRILGGCQIMPTPMYSISP